MAEGTVAADQLRLFIERIERLEEEKKGIADDIRDVYAEAKANGYDTKIMRMIVRLRKMETHTRQEQDALLETYRHGARAGVRSAMAGHSKYKNIMYRKGAQDKKRSALFSKLSREITVAAKMGLPDPGRQRAAPRRGHRRARPVDAQGQYPALDRQGRRARDAENYEEIRYEGFGPGGVAIIVEALTDNRNRTATNVRTALLQERRQPRRQRQRQPRLRAARPDRISGERGRCRQGARSGDRGRRRGCRERRGRPPHLDQHRQPARGRARARADARRRRRRQARVEARRPRSRSAATMRQT